MKNEAAYREAIQADDDLQAELVRVYGKKNAGDARYRNNHSDPALLAAFSHKLAADAALRGETK